MTKLALPVVFVALVIATGCPRLASPYSESSDTLVLDDDSDEGDSSESDDESSPIEDLPMGESTTSDCESDTSGLYLFALETALGPDIPLQFLTTLEVDCSGIATFEFQPLSLDMGSQTEPREPVGDPLVYEGVELDALGNFTLDLGLVEIPGATNPVTGSDISATLAFAGHVVHGDALCGDVMGMLISPLEYDLAGSTFAMIRVAGLDALPNVFPYRCNQVPPP